MFYWKQYSSMNWRVFEKLHTNNSNNYLQHIGYFLYAKYCVVFFISDFIVYHNSVHKGILINIITKGETEADSLLRSSKNTSV